MTFSNSIDINSCLQFLLDLYGQWLSPSASPKPPLMLRNEVIKSVSIWTDIIENWTIFETSRYI